MKSKVEIKNLCPMIAMISSGKTSILNTIFDIDFLEAVSGIGTKFINIIRYNPLVGKNPKFYHLVLEKNGDDYEYYKDPNFPEIVGKDNICQKNKDLNAEYKKRKDVPYEELFYMVEVGEANLIEDKEYLQNYDLVDIPGVNEYNPDISQSQTIIEKPLEDSKENFSAPMPSFIEEIFEDKDDNKEINKSQIYETMEDEMAIYNPNQEKSYLTEIFKIIKNKMNNGIIVFSVDNYQHVENYRIIAKLQKVIGKPIENFLILLNKIDKSENKDYDLNTLNNKIMKYFPSAKLFNPTKNLIVPCSKIQLENESKMNKSFKHLLYFHFLNFILYSKNSNSGTPTTTGFSFTDFLKKMINNQKIKKKTFIEKINKIIEDKNLSKYLEEIKEIIKFFKLEHQDDNLNLGVREDDFKEEEIKKIQENLQTDEGEEEQNEEEGDNEDFNFYDLEGNVIILYYYSEFKAQKNIPPKSIETEQIIDYFTMKNMNTNLREEDAQLIEETQKKEIEQQTLNNKIDSISKRMEEFYLKYKEEKVKEENLDNLQKYR